MTTVDGNCLAGVSATTLRTLLNRATEAKRPDGVIDDPWAIRLFEAIGYDIAPRPGRGLSGLVPSRWLDRIGPLRRVRPTITLLEFA